MTVVHKRWEWTVEVDEVTLRERGAWLGVVVAALGWLLTLVVLARGGGYLVVVPHLSVVLPLAVVGTVTALAAFGVGRTIVSPLAWLGVVVLFGFFWNFLVYWVHFGSATWSLLLPLAKPTGVDFRDGLYQPAMDFTTARSGWPPLTLLLGRPFTLFGFSTGYAIQVVLLVALALASTALSAILAWNGLRGSGVEVDSNDGAPSRWQRGSVVVGRLGAWQIGLVVGLWLLTSYGLMYEIERGNIDIYALFFALLSVWLMLKLPRSPWWPAIALAISINLKLYPGVLLVLLLWRYRWKAVVPALVTNLVLLLIAGPGNVVNTFTGQSGIQSSLRPLWWGNQSAAALSNVLHQISGWPSWMYIPLLAIPLLIWVATMVLVVRQGWSVRTAVLAAAACVPVMSVVPPISHDYKLVLYVFPLAVLVAFVAGMVRRDLLAWSVVFGLLAWVMLQLSRSSLVIAPALLNSKYAMIVFVQALLLFVAWRSCEAPHTFTAEPGAIEGRAGGRIAGGVVAGSTGVDCAATPVSALPRSAAASRLAAWFRAGDVDAPEAAEAEGGPVEGDSREASAAAPRQRPWPTRRMLCIILLILAAVLGANFWVGIVHNTFNDRSSAVGVPQHDFFQYYAGGHNWNLGVDPYVNHPTDSRVMHQPRPNYPQISGYIYPPTLLPLFGALAKVGYNDARTVWLALNVSVFALMALVAVAVSKGRRLEVFTAAVLLTMVSFAFFYHVHEGQIDMIIAALSISGFLLYPRWKGWPSAALLAAAVAMKVSPILLVAVIVLYFRDWRFLLKVLACGLVIFLGSLAFVDAGLYREYVTRILPTIAGSDSSPFNQTPLRFWWKYPTAVKIGSFLGYAALLFLTWVAGRNSRRVADSERRVDLRTERNSLLLLAVVLMLLFSPLAWQMAYVWVIVPLALVLTAAPPRGKEFAVLILAFAAALLEMRMWPYRVLDMTNMIGAAVAAVCLMLYYLPLDVERLRVSGRGAMADDPSVDAGETAEAQVLGAADTPTGGSPAGSSPSAGG